ncbi:MAG: hypothetical protein HY784_09370, partial [Chloroflexi bacterium]|nr:hypothetical protein [Chloroflexota bacterium]
QRTADKLGAIQQAILDHSTIGKDIKTQQADLEAAAKALQSAGERLTQEKFLELVVKAPNENQAMALVGMARNAVDYNFFQMLTRKIDRAAGEEKARLTSLRDKILEFTKEMDAAAEAQAKNAGEMLKALLESKDPDALLAQLLPQIDETFLAVLSANLQAAEQAGRKDLVERLNFIGNVIMAAIAESAPPEIRIINELLALPDDEQAKRYLRERAGEMTQQVFDAMAYVTEDLRKNGRAEAADRLEQLHGLAMAEAMAARLKA